MEATTQIEAVTCQALDNGQLIVRLIDQRLLPEQEVWRELSDPEEVAQAITDMVVRGAPAIGVTAAYGLAQAMALAPADDWDAAWDKWCARFAATRPTAVNLFWAIDRLSRRAERDHAAGQRSAAALFEEATAVHDEDRAACAAMGRHGAALLPDSGGVLHHCNTGALATGGIGTALGVLRAGVAAGKDLHIWVDETRPYLQGARLTAWECVQDNLPATLITDNMAGWMMQQGKIAAAIVGSDRIAANGDVANKIGTYAVAVLCKHHGIPFYVAAPTSTVDLACPTGAEIPIEQRTKREVSHVGGWAPAELVPPLQVAPAGIGIENPAFDVTPAELVTAIITEQGVAQAPYADALSQMVAAATRTT
ncbi:MAG: S-methyl-5-thioribose-1-phosphate isomerase [Myxococcales bacterium]|nr:S-methyl-5-thioribose-1-phosphate isomerase [Myxococcales bacterium]